MDGVIQQQGRVEVCVDGVWSGICDDGWDKTNAYIVCQQLGFASTDSTAFPDSVFGNGDGPLIYSNVACVGHESTITDCSKSMFPDFTCTKGNSAGVMCADGCTDGMVRLVNGVTARDGTVEVCFDNLWGLVGTTGWTNLDALVVCNQVGLGDTQNPTPIIDAPKPQKTIHLNNVYCNGAEKGLAECRYHKLPITDPSSYPVAGVNCPPPNITTSSSSSVIIQATQLPHTENALFLITGVFGVFVVVGIVGVLSLLILLVIIYQKRKGTEDILKRQADGVKDNMSLYAVVNKNRDSVSYSGGAIGLPENL
jgi:deleted-in-malignant-brain-tumors protein 1